MKVEIRQNETVKNTRSGQISSLDGRPRKFH